MRHALFTVLLTTASMAHGQAPERPELTPPTRAADPLRDAMHLWHRGERVSGFVPFLGSGLVTSVTGSFLVTNSSLAAKGAGWMLIGFGVLEVAAGLFFGLTSFSNEAARDLALTVDREKFLEGERARMKRITTLFQPVLLGIEAALVAGGGVTAGVGALRNDELMVGLGLGLAVQALVFFVLDWAVKDRADAYALALGL